MVTALSNVGILRDPQTKVDKSDSLNLVHEYSFVEPVQGKFWLQAESYGSQFVCARVESTDQHVSAARGAMMTVLPVLKQQFPGSIVTVVG